MRTTAPKVNQFSISTRCRSVEQFIGTFHRFTAAESIFVASLIDRPPGFETGFSFALADGTPVLRGTGVVLETWKTADNPFQLPGFTLAIKWLSPRSVAVFRQLQLPRRSSTSALLCVAPPPPDPKTPPPVPGVPQTQDGESWSGPTRTATKRPNTAAPIKALPPPIPGKAAKAVAVPRWDDDTEPVTPAAARTPDSEMMVLASAMPVEIPTPDAAPRSARRSRRWMLDLVLVCAATGCIVLCSESLPTAAAALAASESSTTNVATIASHDHGPPVVGDGPCRLVVWATPAGSIVALDGVMQGESPIAIATSCGQHLVEISTRSP